MRLSIAVGLWEGEENTQSALEGVHCSERLYLKIRRRTSGYYYMVKRTALSGECHGWISTRLPQRKEHRCEKKHPSEEIPADTFVYTSDQSYINVLSNHLSFHLSKPRTTSLFLDADKHCLWLLFQQQPDSLIIIKLKMNILFLGDFIFLISRQKPLLAHNLYEL